MKAAGQRACVLGLGASGRAAVELLLSQGAHVIAVDAADSQDIRDWAAAAGQGADIRLGNEENIAETLDVCVVSPGMPMSHPQVRALREEGVPVWSELELGWQSTHCPSIAITGTNGKTTTTEMVTAMLKAAGQRTIAAGNIGTPLSSVAGQSNELDWVTLEVSSFQLEPIDSFHPHVAVLLNLAPDHLDRHGTMDDYVRAKARIFENQTPADFALIQWQAWQELQRLGVKPTAKVFTFGHHASEADLSIEGSQIISRLPDGPAQIDLPQRQSTSQHNSENLLAAWLVGHCLQLRNETTLAALGAFSAGPHRCEVIGESSGVKFFNDSKATNVHALCSALRAMPKEGPAKNVWLIAGGQDKGLDFAAAEGELKRRVKRAILIGESALKIQAAWAPFAPCQITDNLIQAVTEAGRNAVPGDVVLLSPACASFDMFDSYQHRGEAFREAFAAWQRARGPGD